MSHRVCRFIVAVALAAAGSTGLGQSIPNQQRFPPSRAWSEGPLITETKTDIIVLGAADSATQAQARTSSYDNAVYRTAIEITNRLFAQQGAPLGMGLDSLSAYVRRVSRVLDQTQAQTATGYQGRTRLQTNRTFLDPLTITKLTPPPKPDALAVGYLLLPSNLGKVGTVTGRAPVRAASASKGNFVFTFSIRQTGAGKFIRLESIEVIDDGSVGNTLWQFDVSVNRRRAFGVPVSQYDDRVRTYSMTSSNRRLEFTFGGAEPYVEIKVAGTKPQAGAELNY